ncbi:MAG: hypothetical protein ACP5N6_09460 [Anaerolineae bacterium]|uniref:hypothetical protein n=1 Tax=Thermogutta sp. TaxID=1962930 RepID=UPI003220311C
MHLLIAFVAAVWVSSLLYRLVPVPASVDRARLAQVMATDAPPVLPFWRVLLVPFNALASRLPPALNLNVEKQLYWAQFVGNKWEDWTAVEFWGLRLAVTLLGFAFGMLALEDWMVALVVAAIVYAYVGSRLSGPAERAIQEVERGLPEIAGQIAMLVGMGKPISEALRVAAGGKGLLSRWLQWTLACRPAERPLLGRGSGFLREEAERSRVSGLVNLAVQLDILQEAGVGSQLLLGSFAESVAAEYQTRVMARAEALDDKLVPIIMVFYFVPYIAGLLIPIFAGNVVALIGR